MSTENSYRERYTRRFLWGATAAVALLFLLASHLPFRVAGEISSSRATETLERWSAFSHERARLFAERVQQDESIEIALLDILTGDDGTEYELELRATNGNVEEAFTWASNALQGFDLRDYFIAGHLPDRPVGDIAFVEGKPHLIALIPQAESGNEWLTLVLGPSLESEYGKIRGQDRLLAVIKKGELVFASDQSPDAAALETDPQLAGLLRNVAGYEKALTANLDVMDGRPAVIAPQKDFDQWEVTGAYILAREAHADRQSLWTIAVALLAAALAAGVFYLVGRSLMREDGGFGSVTAMAASTAGIVCGAAILLWLGERLSKEAIAETAESLGWIRNQTGSHAASEGGFFSSLELLALLALAAGAVAIALFFLYSISRLRHFSSLRQAVAAAGFLAPAIIYLAIFTIGPVLFAFFISFHRWEVLGAERPFIGLANYAELLSDPVFWTSLFNTLIYSLHVPVTMAIALALALALQHKIRGVTILRTLFFLPYITSFVAISTVWQWLYNTDFGLINYILSWFGLGPVAWLSDPGTAMLAVMIMSVWIQLGYQMVIFLAGLHSIPQHLYEAATIDGAGPLTRFRKITLPLLRPTVFFILVTSIINSFQVFTYVYVMTQGGPLHSTEVLVYHIYKNAWEYFRMGYASALSWVLFLLILIVTLVQFAFFRKRIEAATA